jgi:ABC-type multidrug transport system ATPase subunit
LESVLTINHLSKNYGKIKAVNDLSFSVPKQSIFGILGPNGSGKTTTLGMVLGVINSTSGDYSWFGESPKSSLRRKIGAILETPTFYPYLSAVDNLLIVAKIKQANEKNIESVLKTVGLYERKDYAFSTFSLGMKQRLAIAAALIADPEVLILDEPTNGLDPQGIADIRNLIRDIAKQGKTIILASHLLDEVEKVCNHMIVMRSGKLLYEGKVADLLGNQNAFEVKADSLQKLEEVAKNWNIIHKIDKTDTSLILACSDDITGASLNKYFYEQGVILSQINAHHTSLEKKFLELLND